MTTQTSAMATELRERKPATRAATKQAEEEDKSKIKPRKNNEGPDLEPNILVSALFFQALRDNPTTNVVTGHIDTVTETGIRMKDGTMIDADVIVTATGLQMRMGGGTAVTVNGEKVNWGGRLLWHGSMIQDVPNMMFMIGYVDASWTLGADATAHSKSHADYLHLMSAPLPSRLCWNLNFLGTPSSDRSRYADLLTCI